MTLVVLMPGGSGAGEREHRRSVFGFVDVPYTFTATIRPTDATMPITYTWMPLPASSQARQRPIPGIRGLKTITVTAQNVTFGL